MPTLEERFTAAWSVDDPDSILPLIYELDGRRATEVIGMAAARLLDRGLLDDCRTLIDAYCCEDFAWLLPRAQAADMALMMWDNPHRRGLVADWIGDLPGHLAASVVVRATVRLAARGEPAVAEFLAEIETLGGWPEEPEV